MTNFNFLLNNLSYLSSEDLVGRPMDSTCFRSAPVPPSFRLRLHPLRMVATLLLLLCIGVGNVWGTDATVALTTSNTSLSSSGITVNSNIAITFAKGSYNNLPSVNTTYTKIYAGNTITFTPTNATITKVVMTASSNDYIKTWNSTVGSVSVNNKTATWTGSQTSAFTFTNSATAQARIKQIAITYTVNASYTVTWTINPAAGGTLSATSGTSTTVTPNSAYTYGDPAYTVTTGSATVSQSTNTFTATPSANCTIRINMVEKPKYTVTLMDDGDTRTQASYGASVTLPSRTGCTGYTFAGWTKTWVTPQSSWTTTAPTIIPTGSYTPSANENLYPVYTKTESGGGPSNDYELYSGSITEGDYIIYYNGKAMNTTVSSDRLQYEEVTPDDDVITTTDESIIWHISASGNYWTIYNAAAEKYAASTGAKNKAQMLADGTDDKSLWTVSGTSTYEFVNKQNTTNSVNANLRNNGTYGFACYSTDTGGALSLYKNVSGGSTTSYISVPNCCTQLGTINGSVSWSNGQATVSWDKLSNVDGTTPYAVSVSPSAGVTVNSIDLTGAKATCSVTGLTAGTAYTFTINAYGDASHCDKSQAIPSTAPQITVKSAPVALTGSDYAEGVSGGGTVKTFTVSGVGLTGALTFTAPTNFQVSTDNGSTWSTSGGSKTLAASGTLAETTIKARLVEGLSVGTYGGTTTYITISGGGAAAVNSSVSITGTVSSACSVPTIGNPSLTSITGTTITVSCPTISGGTNCDVDEYGFIWKAGSAPTMASYDGKKKTGENNQSTAYNDGLSIDVANNTGTTYYIKAYAHNSAGNNVSGTALQVTPRSVAFNMNGHGSQVATQYVNNGSKASEPSAPSASYYTFNGWKLSGSAYNFSTATVTSDITLDADWSVIPVTALTLNYSTLKRYVGESDVTLSVSSVTPNTANPAVTWSSSDATVASVDGGVVSFLKAGTATITATSTVSGGVTATCSVEVRSISSPTMQDEDGTTISGSGLSATWTLNTRTLAASEGTSKYKFKRWIVTNATPASTTNLSTTLGDPTGNVTVVAEFYKPRTVTKGTGTGTSTFTVSPTGEVKYGSSVTVTCAATDGYKNPWTLTVTPSDGATYDETGSTGSITISNITKNITVDLAYTDKGCTTHGASSITSGASDGDDYGPTHAYYKYSTSQILYTRDDLGLSASTKKGTIKSIYFQYSGAAAMNNRSIVIYMANTTLSSLSTTSFVPYSSFTQVYSGTFGCTTTGWYEIELDEPFEYNGVGKLVVMIDDNTNSYEDNKNFKYHSATGAQIYARQDGGDIDPENWTPASAINYRPNTKFCIEEADMVEATVNWHVNGSIEHSQTAYEGTALTGIPTPVSGDCDGEKEFVGWYTADYTHATIAPAFVNPTVIPEGGADYYAVFATATTNYKKSTKANLLEGTKVVLVNGTNAVASTAGTTDKLDPVSISAKLSDGVIANPGSSIMWTVALDGSKYQFKQSSNYLNAVSGTGSAGKLYCNATSDSWSINTSSSYYYMQSTNASNRKLEYYNYLFTAYNGTPDGAYWIDFYTQVFTNYATTCATMYDVNRAGATPGTATGGTFTVSPSKQAAGKTVTLSATPDLGYAFGSWTVTKTESPYTDITSTNVAGNTLTMPAFDVTVNATFTPTPELTATGGDLSSTTLPFGTSCEQDEGTDKTFVLNGYSLTNDVTLTIGGTDASMFSVKSPSSPIDKGTGRITDQTVTVTFTPTSTGTKTATLTIASSGASSVVLTLSGTAVKHYQVHYWNSGIDVHQESVLAGTDASATWDGVDDEDGCDTETYKYFVGWSKTNVGSTPTTTKPTIGETYTSVSSDVHYYAVWTDQEPSDNWVRYESSTIAEGDYLVVEKVATSYYTMKNIISSNRTVYPTATMSGTTLTAPAAGDYDIDDFIWHIAPSATDGYYTIYSSDESKYLASNGTAKQIALVASPSDGKELFSYTYDGTYKTYSWINKYNNDTPVKDGDNVTAQLRQAGSGFALYKTTSNTQYLYYKPSGAKYITNCCDKNVTLATNSPANGTITFSPEGTIGTCGADAASRQTTMTVTPNAGYYLSAWSTSGVTPYSVSPAIAYGSVSNSGAQATTVTFTQNTTTGTYTANATFTAIPVSSLSLRAQQTGQSDKVGNDLTMNCYPKEGQTGGHDPLNHTLKVLFEEVLPANALDKTYDWSVRVKATGDADWTAVGFTGNALNTNSILHTYNKSTGTLIIKATEGTAEIKITAHDGSGVNAKVTITVANVALSSLNVAKSATMLYLGEAEDIAVTYDPVNTTTKGYTTGSYTYVTIGRSSDKITLTGKAVTPGEPERVTLTSSDAGAKTATINVTVKPLPKVTFVDNLQGKTDFSNWGSDGVVSSTVTDGVVTHTKPTPSHTDISDPGASYNACERSHLHLVGWIESTWADAHPSATHSEITGANASNGAGTFLEAGADFNVETYNGNTYYAVWSQVE